MPASLTYAGVPLSQPTPDVAAWVEAHISVRDVFDLARLDWPGKNRIGFPFGGRTTDRKIKVGTLYWPRDASRFAVGYFLVSGQQLAAIRQQCFLGPYGYSAQPFILNSLEAVGGALQRVDGIAPLLFMLPARPLAQVVASPTLPRSGDDMYLLTLVDWRYFWWSQTAAALNVTEGTTAWADLYAAVFLALGFGAPAVDAIDGNYLLPSGSLTTKYEYLPLLLDAIATNVGQRIVYWVDGTLSALNVTTSSARVNAAINTLTNTGQSPRLHAGGLFWLQGPGNVNNEEAAILPQSVTVTFPYAPGISRTCDPYAIIVPLTDLVTIESMADLAGVGTYPGTKVFHDTCAAVFCSDYARMGQYLEPDNDAELQDLSVTVARDWYRYQASRLDWKLAGIHSWVGEGISDFVEWTFRADEVSTRVQRPPFNDLSEERNHAGSFGSWFTSPDTRLVRISGNVQADGSYPGYVQLWNPTTGQWSDGPCCWVVDANQAQGAATGPQIVGSEVL